MNNLNTAAKFYIKGFASKVSTKDINTVECVVTHWLDDPSEFDELLEKHRDDLHCDFVPEVDHVIVSAEFVLHLMDVIRTDLTNQVFDSDESDPRWILYKQVCMRGLDYDEARNRIAYTYRMDSIAKSLVHDVFNNCVCAETYDYDLLPRRFDKKDLSAVALRMLGCI